MGERYLWIRFNRESEDGYYVVGPLTREQLEARIAADTQKNEFGDWENGEFKGFISEIPCGGNGFEQLSVHHAKDNDGKALILQIDVVVPKPVRIVESWTLPE